MTTGRKNMCWPPKGKPHIRKLKRGKWVVRVYNPVEKILRAAYFKELRWAMAYAKAAAGK